jgi:formamidopyrimidine-DNA glycosylase
LPELPEVEVTRRGLEPQLAGRRISGVAVREARLRWRIPREVRLLTGRTVRGVARRAKYLLVDLGDGHLILHLGMSGSLRVLAPGVAPGKHDHFDLELGDRLLAHLGVEPLSRELNARHLHALTRGVKSQIKPFLMDGKRIVGVGNIYASESLFRAGIDPRKASRKLSLAEAKRLVPAIKRTLLAAIKAGGSSLRDFVGSDGASGYFQQRHWVYDRAGQPCRRCRTPIRRIVQGQRATYYCPRCQR